MTYYHHTASLQDTTGQPARKDRASERKRKERNKRIMEKYGIIGMLLLLVIVEVITAGNNDRWKH